MKSKVNVPVLSPLLDCHLTHFPFFDCLELIGFSSLLFRVV
jgi:hypothetical protein